MKKIKRALILSGGGGRGAYQVGVWRYLTENGWNPDVICGTSVGAINAVSIGSGMTVDQLVQLWRNIERSRVYRVSLRQQFRRLLRLNGYTPVFDSAPLREYLGTNIDFGALKRSPIEVVITAVSVVRSKLSFFTNRQISIDHVLASSAIPVLFPWQIINGEPYWDGGVMANTPIMPALERGATEIVVVLLSPVGGTDLPFPESRNQALERVFEQSLIGSYEALMHHLPRKRRGVGAPGPVEHFDTGVGNIRLVTVSPSQMLGFQSILNFTVEQSDDLLEKGYRDAKRILGGVISGGKRVRAPLRKKGRTSG